MGAYTKVLTTISDEFGFKVSLIPFKFEHVDLTFEWIKYPDFQRLFLMRGVPTLQTHKNYFDNILKDPSQRIFAIIVNNRHVGNCGLKNISQIKKEGEIWIYVGEKLMQGRGIGKKATQLLLNEAFEVHGLKRVYIHVAYFNTIARKLYQKLGFTEIQKQNEIDEWKDRGVEIIRMELIK